MSKAKKPHKVGTSKFSAAERKMMITLAWTAGAAVSECDKVGGARAEAAESELLRKAISRGFIAFQTRTDENLSGTEPDVFDFEKGEARFLQDCPAVLAMLEAKDAENVDAYKTLVLEVAYSVAAAYGDGFRGRGKKVSDAENSMIDKIAGALKATQLLDAVKKEGEAGKLT